MLDARPPYLLSMLLFCMLHIDRVAETFSGDVIVKREKHVDDTEECAIYRPTDCRKTNMQVTQNIA